MIAMTRRFRHRTNDAGNGWTMPLFSAVIGTVIVGSCAMTGCTPSSGTGEIAEAQPLIVNSKGMDISTQKPALAKADQPTTAAPPGTANTTAQNQLPPVFSTAAKSTRSNSVIGTPKSAKSKSAPSHRGSAASQLASHQHSASPAASAAPNGPAASQPAAASQTPRIVLTCSVQSESRDPKMPWPDTVALQGIMTGQRNTALMDGKVYAVGDHFGPEDCAWTVSEITSNSVTLERPQDDRTFAVTIYRDQQMPTVAVRK